MKKEVIGMSEFKLNLSILGNLEGAKEAYLKLHEHDNSLYRPHEMHFELYFDNPDSLEFCCFMCSFSFNNVICFLRDEKDLRMKIAVPPMIHSLIFLIEDMLPYTIKCMRIPNFNERTYDTRK